MKTIYIAGPMRGIPLYNFPAFDEAEKELVKYRWTVISPATMDRQLGFDPAVNVADEAFLRLARERDALAILNAADAMAVLPGWENSIGAKAEIALAKWKGIPIYLYPSMQEMNDEGILEEALRITSGDRAEKYGPPEEDFARTAKLWTALKGVEFTARDVARFMIALKLSRDVHYPQRDNCTDIAGYARCGSLCDK